MEVIVASKPVVAMGCVVAKELLKYAGGEKDEEKESARACVPGTQ